MRKRPLILLSTLAAATLLLAGCSGDANPDATGDPTASPDAMCLADLPSGTGSEAVSVEGSGASAKISVPAGTEISEAQRTVISEGDGDDVKPGDLVSLRYQLLDAATNEVLSTSDRGPDGVLPALLASQQPQQPVDITQLPVITVAAECLPIGSSAVVTLPPGQEGANPSILYVETIDELPTIASGEDVAPVDGMPTVELDEDGAPTITVPEGDAPTETEIETLKKGDGPVVAAGDLVTVQYRGVKWSDGSEFDSSWGRGAVPAQFPTTGVVTGFKMALEGQTVGSQVVAVIPPKDGYGASEGNELQNETLVFVVDILATTPLEQAG